VRGNATCTVKGTTKNLLSLRERARVREVSTGINYPLILAFSRREKEVPIFRGSHKSGTETYDE
jgi:hypothetical protein